MTRRPTIAVMFAMLGPYHVARLKAAADVGNVLAIEGSATSDVYAWEKTADAGGMRRITLFADAPIACKKRAEIASRVVAVLAAIRPDVVLVPDWASAWGFAMLAWAASNRVPAIIMSESQAIDLVRSPVRECVKRRVVGAFSAGFAGGRRHADYLAQLGMARERIFTGYDVVDNRHFGEGARRARNDAAALRRRLGLPARYFLASARFVAEKNLGRLIEAYAAYRAAAREGAWGLVILGDGPLRPELERRAAARGLTDAVTMPGFKQYDALPAYYGLAEAFVHVSTCEPWGLVVNEAAAAGLPLIVSDRCGCRPELIEDGRNGLAIDPLDAPAIAAAMTAIAAADRDRAAMGRASEAIVGRWSPETFAAGMAKAVDLALAKPREAPGRFDRLLVTALRRI